MKRTPALAAAGLVTAAAVLAWPAGPAVAEGDNPLKKVKHLVVVYEENHSFDNLYGGWGKVGDRRVDGIGGHGYATSSTQVDQTGQPLGCTLQNDANLVPTTASVKWLDGTLHPGRQGVACSSTTPKGVPFDSHFTSSAPFAINDYVKPADATCAPATAFAANGVEKGDPQGRSGGCTRDLVHRFYQEQYQIDGGKQDRYPTGSDAAGLTQGYYDTTALPVYQYLHGKKAPKYVVADHFFQGAFGGSFLTHQYLVAGRAPEFDTSQKPVPTGKNSSLDAAGFPNSGYPLYAPLPGATYNDSVLTQTCPPGAVAGANGLPVDAQGRACGNFGVNTMQPSWPPTAGGSNVLPGINDVDPSKPFYQTNIGDELTAKNVSWSWYAGGWDNAAGNTGSAGWTNGSNGTSCTDPNHSPTAVYPYCADPLFQFHHQPFNYFQNYAPGAPGRTHLQDEAAFLGAVDNGTLPAVSFVKPIGAENEHPGYASTDSGESHLVDLLKRIESGPDAASTLVVVTYDEFGGAWDHVAPPGQGNSNGPSDAYGPGTRVPALVVGKPLAGSTVDHTSYDTTSILATIERGWGVRPLGTRDAHVNDLSHALKAADD
jgi:phospholipase C